MVKKRLKKGKNNFNFGTGILIIGIFIFIIHLFYLLLIGVLTEFNLYLKWISLFLIYFGVVLHFVLIGDKPFLKSWNYLKSSKNFIWSVVIIFFIFALIGFFVPAPDILSEKIIEFLKNIIDKTDGMSAVELIVFLFNNNLQASFIGMIFGIFLGIFPVLVAAANGYLVGFVGALSVNENGFSVLLNLLPHGIFELPAVFISLGLGVKIGTFIFQNKKLKYFKNYFWSSLRVFVFIVLPLLIIAAIIEGTLIYFIG
ncbi:MAG: stage II sporulation protein M [Candidatus Pacearchaeota archaeon]